MTARELFQAGRLNEAVTALSAELRDNPLDSRRRTFLFELLCFTGDFDRARKHLELLAKENQQAGMGALLYEACMHAERTRQETFEKKDYPQGAAKSAAGKVNGKPFASFADADSRIGPRLEVFTAGAYLWIPLEHVESVEMQAPKRLRDMLWANALIRTGPNFRQVELGECLIPVLYPGSAKHSDDNVRLGRTTMFEEDESGNLVGAGQRIFLADDDEIPILEIRKIEFDQPAASESSSDAS